MAQYHIGLRCDGFGIALHSTSQFFLCSLIIVFGIIFYALGEFVITTIGGVVGEHIEDETLFDGLLHTIEMERMELAF